MIDCSKKPGKVFGGGCLVVAERALYNPSDKGRFVESMFCGNIAAGMGLNRRILN